MTEPVDPATPVKSRPSAAGLVISTAFIGALVGPLALGGLFLVMTALDPSCRGGGNEGGCAMGVWAGAIVGVPIGFIVGLVVGGVRAARRPKPTPPI